MNIEEEKTTNPEMQEGQEGNEGEGKGGGVTELETMPIRH